MTTVIYTDEDFVASDSKWACDNSLLVLDNHCVYKYVYFDQNQRSILAFFAGDEYPIVSYQAKFLGGIDEVEFIKQVAEQGELNLSLEWLLIDATNGSFVGTNATIGWFQQLRHLGSGGLHAAQFFYYSKKAKYNSIYKNNVVGAMNYAYYKDERYSGPPHTIRSWNKKHLIDNTVKNNHHLYTDSLISRLGELQMNYRNGHNITDLPSVAKLSSVNRNRSIVPPLKTTQSNTSPKVTVSGAISMLNLLKSL
ncbi:TPA: hypothetical protein ACGD7T_005400 [Serratia marcescens]